MIHVGVIGGTGAQQLVRRDSATSTRIETPYGMPSSPVLSWQDSGTTIHFIARHGFNADIPPHLINYRANIWAMRSLEPSLVIGINAVGGIGDDALPGWLAFPDQLIDYTWGREHTFHDGIERPVNHVEFTSPVSESTRGRLMAQAGHLGLDFVETGTYGATQGPRLETSAEIDRMARDGCTLVGMTAMPEAALAREAGLHYAICAVIVNRAAGRGRGAIHDEIEASMERGMTQVRLLLTGIMRAA